jgi:poly(3-hydroxybutyrate) depolymerase
VRYWTAIEGCTSEKDSRISAHVDRIDFIGCRGSDVELYKIDGGVHGWPDSDTAAVRSAPDEAPMHELPASETIAQFLLQHRR